MLLLAVSAALLNGCRAPNEPLGQVHGKVTFQGQPFSEAELVFCNESHGIRMTVPLDDEGRYEVRTAGRPGLPPGDYQIHLRTPRIDAVTGGPLPKLPPRKFPDIPSRYRKLTTSGLEMTVAEGDNPFDIDLLP